MTDLASCSDPPRDSLAHLGSDPASTSAPARAVVGAGLAVYLDPGAARHAAVRGVPRAVRLPAVRAGRALDAGEFCAIYSESALYARILPDTLIFVAGTVALTFAIALRARLADRAHRPAGPRDLVRASSCFPLLVPIPVLAIAWIFLMGPNAGWLNLVLRVARRLRRPGPINIFSMAGLILCQSLASVPLCLHPADRGAAHHEPGARGGERQPPAPRR